MPPETFSVGSMMSNYWVTDNIRDFSKLADEALKTTDAKGDSTQIGETAPEVDFAAEDAKTLGTAITRDSVISSIAAKGGGNPLKNIDGQVKLLSFGSKDAQLPDDDLKAAGAKAYSHLGLDSVNSFEQAIDATARMNRLYMEDAPTGELTDAERQNAMRTLSNVLTSGDFARLTGAENAPNGETASIGKDGLKALLNATLGVMKACRDNDVTAESVLSIQQGTTYDLGKGADVLKLAVESARQARVKFVDEDNLKALLERPEVQNLKTRDPGAFKSIEKNVNWIISVRKQLSESLDIKYDITDALSARTATGRQRAIDSKVRDACNALRAFRYEMDGFTGRLSQAEVMSKLRRSCDNATGRLWRSQTPRLPAGLYEALKNTEADLTRQLESVSLSSGEVDDGAKFASADETSKAAADLTHEVNNAVRYHFSGREQKLDAFAKKMHEMFDPLMEKGGSREVTFEGGVDAKIGLDKYLAKLSANAGATGTHRAKITIAEGGGVTVTYFNGGSVSGGASAKFGIATAKANAGLGGGVDKTYTYRSLDDFIRDAAGESILAGSAKGAKYCLGMIGGFFCKVGHGLTAAATAMGFRIHHSQIQMANLRQQLTDNHVVDSLDTVFASTRSGHAVKTVIKMNNEVFGSMDLSADLAFGPEYAEGKKYYGAGAKLSGSFKKEGKVTTENFRSFVDSVKLQSDAWLDKRIAAMEKGNPKLFADFTAAKGDPKAQLGALMKALRDTENAIAKTDDDWKAIASSYRDFAVLLVRIGRGELDDEMKTTVETMLEPRIRSPRADIPEDIFQSAMVNKTGESHAAKTTYDVSVKFTYDIGASALESMAAEKTGLKDGASELSWKGFGSDVGLDAANSSVKTGLEKFAGLKGSLAGSIHVENVDGAGAHVTEMSTEVTRNMPMGAFANWVAEQCIKADDTIPKGDMPAATAKMAKDILTTMTKTFAADVVENELKKLTFDQALNALNKSGHEKVASFIGAMFKTDVTEGLEKSFDKTATKLFKFTFDKGRVTGFSIVDKDVTSGMLGARVEASPIASIGMHITEKYVETKTVATILERPSLATFLKPVGNILSGGTSTQLHAFIVHNRQGVVRLGRLMANQLPEGGDRYPADGKEAREKLDALEADLRDAATQELSEDLADRLQKLRTDLAAVRNEQSGINWSDDSNLEENLSTMEKLFVLNVKGNNLLSEIKFADA